MFVQIIVSGGHIFWPSRRCLEKISHFIVSLNPYLGGPRRWAGHILLSLLVDQSLAEGDRCTITVLLPSLSWLCLFRLAREDKRWGDACIRGLLHLLLHWLTVLAHDTSLKATPVPFEQVLVVIWLCFTFGWLIPGSLRKCVDITLLVYCTVKGLLRNWLDAALLHPVSFWTDKYSLSHSHTGALLCKPTISRSALIFLCDKVDLSSMNC